jgi:Tol biopolymer transport system component
MSLKHLSALVCAAALMAAAGCSSGQAGGTSSSTTSAERAGGPAPSSTSVPATSTSSVVPPVQAPDAWKSDVIVRVTQDMNGGDAHGASWRSTLSNDGRYVAFESDADDLVPGDTNRLIALAPDRDTPAAAHTGSDVFVFDRQTGAVELVSPARDGTPANGDSNEPHISATGRWVAFQSNADNLVPGDTNKWTDVFRRDRQTGTTELVSAGLNGAAANGRSYARGVSADGRYVVFASAADNLVPGDTNRTDDVFIRDLQAGTTELVSVGPGGEQGNEGSGECAISADGRFVAFQSSATNLVQGDTNGSADISSATGRRVPPSA